MAETKLRVSVVDVNQARTQGFEKGGYTVEKIFIEYLAFNVKLFFNMQE